MIPRGQIDGGQRDGSWTGGQYSLVRAILGLYLFVHFAMLVPWGREIFSNVGVLADGSSSPLMGVFPNLFWISDDPLFVQGVLIGACALSLMLAAGCFDRVAAVLLWLIWASLFGRNPLISNPSLPYIGLLLLVHAGTPTGKAGPFGAWSTRGRLDPGGGWQFPRPLFRVLWVLMSVGYSYSGFAKLMSPSWRDGTALERVLANPLSRPGGLGALLLELPDLLLRLATWGALGFELLFVVFAWSRKLRPFTWLAMLAMHFALILLIDFADLSLGMVILHLFTFDPSWIKGCSGEEPEIMFYDGECGLCHRAVRFNLAEDMDGRAFRYAPLQGTTFEASLSSDQRATIADSVVVLRRDGTVLQRSDAIAHMLVCLGGYWGLVGRVMRIIPRALRDLVYDGIASIRRRVFSKPAGLCPMLPPHLASRFLG